jgi:predicted metal-dependent phosphoesterase TrpH
MKIDLHVHSRHSPDSSLRVEAIVDQIGLAGVQGFALTDHNSVAGHAGLRELARSRPSVLLIPGCEVSTREGHLLAYGIAEVPPAHAPLAETIEWVEGHGGVAVLAHPLRWSHGVGKAAAQRARVPALESMNAHTSPIRNARAELIAAHRAIGTTGGSDAHELTDVGRGYTEFSDEATSVDDLLEALRRGHVRAGGAPLAGASRVRLAVRTGLLRFGRGLRSI